MVVVICPLNALIDSHILEVKENPKTVNTRNIVFRVRNQTKKPDPLGYRLVDPQLLWQCYDEIHDQ